MDSVAKVTARLKKALRALPKRCQDRGYLLVTLTGVMRFPDGVVRCMAVHYLPTLQYSYGEAGPGNLDHFLGNTPKGYPDRI